jgi:hypothetical protein
MAKREPRRASTRGRRRRAGKRSSGGTATERILNAKSPHLVALNRIVLDRDELANGRIRVRMGDSPHNFAMRIRGHTDIPPEKLGAVHRRLGLMKKAVPYTEGLHLEDIRERLRPHIPD